MNVIRQANSDIIRFLGGEQRNIENIKYRFNKYCIFIKQDRKYTIIYNAIRPILKKSGLLLPVQSIISDKWQVILAKLKKVL